jgi:Aspartyl/Asparaginyl beta-hydroxylase
MTADGRREAAQALNAWCRQAYRGHAIGKFGVPSPAVLLEAEADGRLAVCRPKRLGDATPDPVAAVLVIRRRGASTFRDFRGEPFHFPPGARIAAEVVAPGPSYDEALDLLVEMEADFAVPHLTNRPLIVAMEAAGWAWRATKVHASSELRGLYAAPPGVPSPLPAAEAASLVRLPSLVLSVDEQVAILAELVAYLEGAGAWAQHYAVYNRRHSWTAFGIRGFDADPAQIEKPAEMSKAWKAANPAKLHAPCIWTSAAEAFPKTRAAVERLFPAPLERVRFMRLAPGGELSRHADITDRQAGVEAWQLARLHIPLRSPPACVFMQWDARGVVLTAHLAEGAVYYLDRRKPHAVRNLGTKERIHLVVDVIGGPWLRELLERAAA